VIIEVSHPSLVEDLLEFLRSSSCEAMRWGSQTVDVRAGWPLREGGQRHLDLYLAAWEAKNPGARAIRAAEGEGGGQPTLRRPASRSLPHS
jgi:hypothetical protein